MAKEDNVSDRPAVTNPNAFLSLSALPLQGEVIKGKAPQQLFVLQLVCGRPFAVRYVARLAKLLGSQHTLNLQTVNCGLTTKQFWQTCYVSDSEGTPSDP